MRAKRSRMWLKRSSNRLKQDKFRPGNFVVQTGSCMPTHCPLTPFWTTHELPSLHMGLHLVTGSMPQCDLAWTKHTFDV